MISADKKKEMNNLSEMLLETRGLTKRYGHHKAVDSVSMHIKKGAIYGFIGRNGAEDFRVGEPLPQGRVRHQYLAGDKVVGGAVAAQSRVMVGGNDVCQAFVRFGILPGEGKAFFDDGADV